MTESNDGVFRLTTLCEKFPEQMKAAERIMGEERDILHELSRNGDKNVKKAFSGPGYPPSRV